MKRLGIIIIALGVAWMSVKCAHDVGYRRGIIEMEAKVEREDCGEIITECEIAMDKADEACAEQIEQARIEGEMSVLEMY